MEIIVANPGATAYHFLIHEYKLTRNSTFTEDNLDSFVGYFFQFVNSLGHRIVDKEGNSVSQEKMTETILDNYANYTKNNLGKNVCYFSSDCIEEMRECYEKCNYVYKLLIFNFEEKLARENYNNKIIYTTIEDGYKKSLKHIEKADEKHLA